MTSNYDVIFLWLQIISLKRQANFSMEDKEVSDPAENWTPIFRQPKSRPNNYNGCSIIMNIQF
jgi:hypothetical protein